MKQENLIVKSGIIVLKGGEDVKGSLDIKHVTKYNRNVPICRGEKVALLEFFSTYPFSREAKENYEQISFKHDYTRKDLEAKGFDPRVLDHTEKSAFISYDPKAEKAIGLADILPGDEVQKVWVVQTPLEALAVQTIALKNQNPLPTVIVTDLSNPKPHFQNLLKNAETVILAGSEKDTYQLKDKAYSLGLNSSVYTFVVPRTQKDLLEYNKTVKDIKMPTVTLQSKSEHF